MRELHFCKAKLWKREHSFQNTIQPVGEHRRVLGGRYFVFFRVSLVLVENLNLVNLVLKLINNLKLSKMKSLDEIAKEYAQKVAGVVVPETLITYTIEELNEFSKIDFKAGVEFAQKFIPMSEELPPHNTKILVKDSISESVSYGQFSQDLEWFHCHKSTNVLRKSDLVSWRPIFL